LSAAAKLPLLHAQRIHQKSLFCLDFVAATFGLAER
jgi:hypothetical protein